MAVLFGEIKDTATISNTEYSILDKTTAGVPIAHTGKVRRSFRIRMVSMVAGDEFRGRVYEKTNGGTAEVIHEWFMSGVQPGTYVTPVFQLSEGYDVTLLRTAGTDRVANWNIMDDIGDVNLAQWLAAVPNALASGRVDALAGLERTGTAQAGAATTITLDAGASGSNDFYTGALVQILSGTGAAQAPRLITGYVGSTKVATVANAWATNPDNTSVFAVEAFSGQLESTTLTAVASSVWNAISEGTEKFGDTIRLIAARLFGKATVQDGDGAYAFRDKADTKDRIAMTRTGTARTVGTRDGT